MDLIGALGSGGMGVSPLALHHLFGDVDVVIMFYTAVPYFLNLRQQRTQQQLTSPSVAPLYCCIPTCKPLQQRAETR